MSSSSLTEASNFKLHYSFLDFDIQFLQKKNGFHRMKNKMLKEEDMRYQTRWIYFGFLMVFLCIFCFGCTQEDPEIKNLLTQNIEAIGGQEKVSQVDNYSFKLGNQTIFLSPNGLMKVTSGEDPVFTEITLVSSQLAKKNCFNNITEYEGFEKFMLQGLAKIRGALFTLENYRSQLEYNGLKKFGPKNHHMLTTKEGDLDIEFYLDSTDFLLKRIVFSGFSEEEGKYEVNHDFVSFQEVDGVKIPESWFASQVGTRGSLQNAEDVKFNLDLPEGFFTHLDVNVGEVEIETGSLGGSIIDVNLMREDRLTIGTNWTNSCMEEAGFQSGDKLVLEIADKELDLNFYNTQPPRDTYSAGAKLLVPNRQSENYIIYILDAAYGNMTEQLEPLMPIRLKKK